MAGGKAEFPPVGLSAELSTADCALWLVELRDVLRCIPADNGGGPRRRGHRWRGSGKADRMGDPGMRDFMPGRRGQRCFGPERFSDCCAADRRD